MSITVALAFLSCEKIVPSINSPESYPGDNYNEIFESFWNGMNNNYVFWSVDTTNWDNVYRTYKPLFSQLTVFNKKNDSIAEFYFEKMTSNIIDSHYTLSFNNTGHQFSPALNRKLKIDQSHPDSIYSLPNDFFNSVVINYIDHSFLLKGTDTILYENSKVPFTVISGTINNKILYLYFNGFFLSHAGKNTQPAIDYFLSTVSNLPSNISGIVIDVRENGGGEITDLNYLLGSMIGTPLTFGYTRGKSNIGRLDYTPWAPAILTPQVGSFPVSLPIVVLADHLSVSMAELTTLAIKALPTGKFIGTTTWGANGPLAPSVYYNAGQFTVGASSFGPNGYMFVYTSSFMFEGVDGKVYEGKGVKPDIWAAETLAAYQARQDLQLSAAIKYIGK